VIRLKSIACIALLGAISTMAISAMQADNGPDLQSLLAEAQQAQSRSDFSRAAECYRQAVKLSPDTPELWANLGLMYHQNGESSEAIKSLKEAIRLNPSLFVPHLFLGIENLKLERAEAAIPFLLKAEQIKPGDPQVPLALGRAFAIAGKRDRSSDAYWRAVTLDPSSGDAWLGLGTANLQQVEIDARMLNGAYKDSVYTKLHAGETFAEQGKLAQAADAYKSALKPTSQPPLCAHAGYGIVLLRQQEIPEAREEFDLELKSNPGCALARLGLAAMYLVQGNSESALREIATVWDADQGFLQENLPLLRDAISDEQGDELLRMAKDKELRGELQSNELARETPPRGRSSPQHSERTAVPQVTNKTEMLYLSGQFGKCSDSLRLRLSVLPATSVLLLAPCAFYSGDYRTASLAARKLKGDPGTRVTGLYWESKADRRLAITALTRAGETGDNSPRIHVLLGDLYRQKEQWQDAEQEYDKALALAPQDPSARLGLAMALFANGRSEEALAVDKRLLIETPDDPEENLLAGEILVQTSLFADAEFYLKKSLASGRKSAPRAHTLLGEVYAATDRLPEALSEFKSGLVNDEDGRSHYQIGRLYLKLGDTRSADEAFRVAKQLRKMSDDRTNFTSQHDSTDESKK
jgi:tetratricopeptide (TPR) repeat protein